MPRLNAATIKALTRPGRYADERTLYLNIAPRGSRSWIQRLAINGRRRDIAWAGGHWYRRRRLALAPWRTA